MRRAALVLTFAFGASATSSLWSNELADTIIWHSYGVVAAIAMWWAVLRHAPKARSSWALISLGLTSWVLGDIAWDWLSWSQELPDVSIVDGLYLIGYALFVVGVVALIRLATGSLPSDALVDGAIVTVALGLLFWVGLVEPSAQPERLAYRIVNTSYPIGAMLLFGALAWMRFHPQRRLLPAGAGLLGLAFALLIVTEVASAWYYLYEPTVGLEPALDRAFHVSFALMVLAAFHRGEVRTHSNLDGLHPLRLVLFGCALITGPATMFLVDDSRAPAIVASTVISALVLTRFVHMSRDRERAQSALSIRATHDPLTGLANRDLLTSALNDAAEASAQQGSGVGVLYLDVDGFKGINDTHGHAAGDAILIELSERIRTCLRPGDLAARLGGDEFIILCGGIDSPAGAAVVAERLQHEVADPFSINGMTLATSISIGVAAAPAEPTVDVDRLIESADAALYQAKRAGKGRVIIFDDGVEGWLDAQRSLEAELRDGLDAGQVQVRFEPVGGPHPEQIVGLQARTSLHRVDGTSVDIELDQPRVDRAGVAGRLAMCVIEEIASGDALPMDSDVWVLIRVTAGQLRSPAFMAAAMDLLRDGRPAGGLVFEITEDELATAVSDTSSSIDELIRLGARFALRGFGEAGSTLTGARMLPFDFVLIRSGLASEELTEPLTALAQAMGLTAVIHAEPPATPATRNLQGTKPNGTAG